MFECIDKELDMPLGFYFHLSRQQQNYPYMFGMLFVTFTLITNNFFLTSLLKFDKSAHYFSG